MDASDLPDSIKIFIEVSEDGMFKIQSTPPDERALIAVLEMALFTVKRMVDIEPHLH